VHIVDVVADETYRSDWRRRLGEESGIRTLLLVPLLRDENLVGAFAAYRQEVRPFSAKEIALLENFAAQAVIAMENARLLGELRQRNDEIAGCNQELEERVAAQRGELQRAGRLKRGLARQVAELADGIGDGHAPLRQIGVADGIDSTPIGTVGNLAAALGAEAKGGQILLSQRVGAAVAEAMPLEEMGEVALKGLSQPVAVYNVPLAG